MPKEREVREVKKRLRQEGWEEKPERAKGSHTYFVKYGYKGIPVPTSEKELRIGTYRKIAKMAGWIK